MTDTTEALDTDTPDQAPPPVDDGEEGGGDGDDWKRTGGFVIVRQRSDEEQSTRVNLFVEELGADRRLVLDGEDDEPMTLVATWRHGEPESIAMTEGDHLPAEILDAVAVQLKNVAVGESGGAAYVQFAGGVSRAKVVETVRLFRRLHYSAELANRAGTDGLGDFVEVAGAVADECYDDFVNTMFEVGDRGKAGIQALNTIRRTAAARARADAALAALAAVPYGAQVTSHVVSTRDGLMTDLANAEDEEHEAANAIVEALMGAE